MNHTIGQFGFNVEVTNDGSPTLRLHSDHRSHGESMHHSGGAAAETRYIYGNAIEKIHDWANLNSFGEIKTCVVGLGLGYIEMAWAKALEQTISFDEKKANKKLFHKLHSYEINTHLKDHFKSWVLNDDKTAPTYSIYEDCLEKYLGNFLENKMIFKKNSIKNLLKINLEKNRLILKNSILNTFEENDKYHLICYDAFSTKTSQDLWTQEFLNNFLSKKTEKDCVFTTYACTSVLKQALANQGFIFYKRPGFQGKRDSTLAVKGKFTQLEKLVQTF